MIGDLLRSLRATLYERTVSPLFGAFVISWVLWNYKAIVVLLSGMTAPQKFQYIEQTIYSHWTTGLALLLLAPALTACLFLFLYPYPARYVYKFWRNKQRELKEIRQQIDDATPLTREESRRIRQQVTSIQMEYDNQLQRASDDQERLKQAVVQEKERTTQLEAELQEERSKDAKSDQVEHVPDDEIDKALRHRAYRLHFYPRQGGHRSKIMMFGPNGSILEGQNDYENSWRIRSGKLEFLQKSGDVHSRFHFHPRGRLFMHTNDDDTLSTKGQFLVPEEEEAPNQATLAPSRPKNPRGSGKTR